MRHTYSLTPSFKRAFFFSLTYIVICMLYIVVSGRIAAMFADTAISLQRIELIKGALFVVVTGVLFFLFAFLHLRRLAVRERLIAEQRLLIAEAQRRALAGSFAASIGHDINNILGVIDFGAYQIQQRGALPEESSAIVAHIADAAQKIQGLVERLMTVARKNVRTGIERFDLAKLINDAIQLTGKHARLRHCELLFDDSGPLFISSNPHIIEQVLINILLNAADAACVDHNGKILVRIAPSQKSTCIEVHDNGPGIPEAERERIFDFFHTTKENGAGLGLAGARTSIEMLNGRISIDQSAELGGALFAIALPNQAVSANP